MQFTSECLVGSPFPLEGSSSGISAPPVQITEDTTSCLTHVKIYIKKLSAYLSTVCSLSIFLCFVVPAFLFTAAFLAGAWVTLNSSTSQSIKVLSTQLQMFAVHEVHTQLTTFIQNMLISLHVFQSYVVTQQFMPDSILLYMNSAVRIVSGPTSLKYTTNEGRHVMTRQLSPTQYIAAFRLPLNYSANSTNVTVAGSPMPPPGITDMWYVDSEGNRLTPYARYTTAQFDPLTRPWYVNVMASNTTTFIPPMTYIGTPGATVSLAAPIYNTLGVITGVTAVDFNLEFVQNILDNVRQVMHTNGLQRGGRIFLREIRELHRSLVEVVLSAERVARLRADDVIRMAELRRVEEQTQNTMRAKDMFFAVMSHELRTPLSACIGMAEILMETTTLDTKQRECVETIFSSGSLMLDLVNNLLDFSKLEAQQVTLERVAIDVREVIDRAAHSIEFRVEEKGLELVVLVTSEVPAWCMGDSCRLGQVLLNLLSNATKFTQQGMVVLRCRMSSTTSSNSSSSGGGANDQDGEGRGPQLLFEVEDTGIGMPESSQAWIFEPFMQADATMARRFGGTGLGLTISRRLVRQMGGELDYRSVEGQGSTFFFHIPFINVDQSSGCSLVPVNLVAPPSSSRLQSTLVSGSVPGSLFIESAPVSDLFQVDTNEQMEVILIDNVVTRRQAIRELLGVLGLFCREVETLGQWQQQQQLTEHHEPSAAASITTVAHSVVIAYLQDYPCSSLTAVVQAMRMVGLPLPGVQVERHVIFVSNMANFAARDYAALAGALSISKPVTLTKLRVALHAVLCQHEAAGTCTESVVTASTSFLPSGCGKRAVAASALPLSPPLSSTYSRTAPSPLLAQALAAFQAQPKAVPAVGKAPTLPARLLIVDDIIVNQRVLLYKLDQLGYRDVQVASSGKEALEIIQRSAVPFDLIFMDLMMPEMDGYEATRGIKALPLYAGVPVVAVTGNTVAEDHKACLEYGMADVLTKPVTTATLLATMKKYCNATAAATEGNLNLC